VHFTPAHAEVHLVQSLDTGECFADITHLEHIFIFDRGMHVHIASPEFAKTDNIEDVIL
jgi:hypothetical protein